MCPQGHRKEGFAWSYLPIETGSQVALELNIAEDDLELLVVLPGVTGVTVTPELCSAGHRTRGLVQVSHVVGSPCWCKRLNPITEAYRNGGGV